MRRKGLFFVVGLLALASLMAAMSFSSATITAHATVKITNSSDGLLAMSKGSSNAATADATTGAVSLDLTEGKGGQGIGIQPGSSYTWQDLVDLKNNTSQSISIHVSADTLNKLQSILDDYTLNATVGNNTVDLSQGSLTLSPDQSASVSLTVNLPNDAKLTNTQQIDIPIIATAVANGSGTN